MFNVQKILWQNIRDQVQVINPELTAICDQINPNKNYPLYKITYAYGDKIVKRGDFNIPLADGTGVLPLSDIQIPPQLKKDLDYCRIPLSLILHNSNEAFVKVKRIIPLNFFKEGELFGTFETASAIANTNISPIWTVTAGARSVFMLPKIGDRVFHNKMKKELGLASNAPTELMTQFIIFKDIVHKNGNLAAWRNEIIVFSRKWIENIDITWVKFQQYIYKIAWQQSKLLVDSIEFGLQWASFDKALVKRMFKPRPYIIDTIKHLIAIANGSGVAFEPATNNSALPLELIQNVYVNHYQLKYTPTIMQPNKLTQEHNKLYYSLSFPNTLETLPTLGASVIEDQRQLRILIDILCKTTNKSFVPALLSSNIKFDFFHYTDDSYGEITNSSQIPQDDLRFHYYPHSKDMQFCVNAVFFGGCIRVMLV